MKYKTFLLIFVVLFVNVSHAQSEDIPIPDNLMFVVVESTQMQIEIKSGSGLFKMTHDGNQWNLDDYNHISDEKWANAVRLAQSRLINESTFTIDTSNMLLIEYDQFLLDVRISVSDNNIYLPVIIK